jgi:hypothetical protein
VSEFALYLTILAMLYAYAHVPAALAILIFVGCAAAIGSMREA